MSVLSLRQQMRCRYDITPQSVLLVTRFQQTKQFSLDYYFIVMLYHFKIRRFQKVLNEHSLGTRGFLLACGGTALVLADRKSTKVRNYERRSRKKKPFAQIIR